MFDREKLTAWRTSQGLSKSALGRIIGVANGTICDWESGRYKPGPGSIEKLNRIMETYDGEPVRKERTWQEMWKPCEGCIYLGDNVRTCDYYLITGTRRPCPSGNGCTVRRNGKREYVRPFEMRAPATRFHRMIPATERDPRVRELYESGKNDGEISLETGHSVSSVYAWRKRHNYPTNYNHNKGIKLGKYKGKKGEK